MFSKQNAKNITEICNRNGIIDDDHVYDISRYTGYTLLGLLPPNELQYALETELKIPTKQAAPIVWQLHRYIFLPVRKTLETLYQMDIDVSKMPGATPVRKKKKVSKQSHAKTTRRAHDRYREATE